MSWRRRWQPVLRSSACRACSACISRGPSSIRRARAPIARITSCPPTMRPGTCCSASRALGRSMVTVAPELMPPGFIVALARAGIRVSAGAFGGDPADMQRAAGEGLTGVTHLFNAMSQMQGRAPGLVGVGDGAGRPVRRDHRGWPSCRPGLPSRGVQRDGPGASDIGHDAMSSVGASIGATTTASC